jgi:hypothetical protein
MGPDPGTAVQLIWGGESHMKELFAELMSDWVGQLSAFVIAFVILMAIFFIIWFMKKSGEGPQS